MKICKICKEEKSVEEFYTGKQYKDGYWTFCKSCHSTQCKDRRENMPECPVEGCQSRQMARGLCITHYKRAFVTGALKRTRTLPLKDKVSYNGAHQRVKQFRGLSEQYTCEHCDKQATQWALDHRNATELLVEKQGYSWLKYSLNIDDYIPLCTTCHVAFDGTRGRKKVAA